MYPSDFNAAEAVYTPADEGLVLGVPPLLALVLLLLVLAIAWAAFMLGQKRAGDRKGPEADGVAEDIHKAVLKASTAAMGASSSDLKSKAEALRATITALLGPVLAVGSGVIGPVADLDKALKGEIIEPGKAPHDAGHDADKGKEGSPAAGPALTVNQFFGPQTPPAPGPEKPRPEPKPGSRPMTGPEQIDHLSRAIRRLHDHWSRGDQRIPELKAARTALGRRPPK